MNLAKALVLDTRVATVSSMANTEQSRENANTAMLELKSRLLMAGGLAKQGLYAMGAIDVSSSSGGTPEQDVDFSSYAIRRGDGD